MNGLPLCDDETVNGTLTPVTDPFPAFRLA
jgi:hypothetical protein